MDVTFIELFGEKHAVTIPDFAATEELMIAFAGAQRRGGVALQRVYAAAVGLCTRVGKHAGADYAAERFDVLAYGGKVYTWLRREKGVGIADLGKAFTVLLPLLGAAAFPRDEEVKTALGNSGGSAEA